MADLTHSDLRLARRQTGWLTAHRQPVNLATDLQDLQAVSGLDNLAQAIINRLHTRLGELAELGHPDYGSRLHELVGEPNNARTRAFAELYVRESLNQEPRIQEVTAVVFEPSVRHNTTRHRLAMRVSVLPIATPPSGSEPLTITLSVAGEGAE